MANNPRAFDPRVREARQRAYLAVPTLAQQMPTVEEVVVDMRFMLASGVPHSSPHKRIFVPDMQAFFEVHCPDRDCAGGGFDLGSPIQAAVKNAAHESTGSMQCQGVKDRAPCAVSLHYTVVAKVGGKKS